MPFQSQPALVEAPCPRPCYGWRYERVPLPDGSTDLVQVPLTLRDVLHPREDDHIPENSWNSFELALLLVILRTRLPRVRRGLLLKDCIVNWGVPGVGDHSADLTLFRDVRVQPPAEFGTYYMARYGGRCALTLEVVSPSTRDNDVRLKLAEYYQVGVQQYVLIDQLRELGPREVIGYRRSARGFARMRPDSQGRVRIKALGVLLGLVDGQPAVYDDVTGARLLDYEGSVLRGDEAERLAQQEREARHAAEQLAQQRLEAQHAAEQLALQDRAARHAAEQRARQDREARQAAERRVQEVEREMRRLRGETP